MVALWLVVKLLGTNESFGNGGLVATLKLLTKHSRNAWNHERTDSSHPNPGGEWPEVPVPCGSVHAFTGGGGSSEFISRQSPAARSLLGSAIQINLPEHPRVIFVLNDA